MSGTYLCSECQHPSVKHAANCSVGQRERELVKFYRDRQTPNIYAPLSPEMRKAIEERIHHYSTGPIGFVELNSKCVAPLHWVLALADKLEGKVKP